MSFALEVLIVQEVGEFALTTEGRLEFESNGLLVSAPFIAR